MTDKITGASITSTPSSATKFQTAYSKMIATNDSAYKGSAFYNSTMFTRPYKDYTLEEINSIIQNGTAGQKAELSRAFYYKDGFYKRITSYFGTMLKNIGILIPNPSHKKSIEEPALAKRYHKATNFVDKMDLANNLTRISMKVIIDGAYYGVITSIAPNTFSTLDLPFAYCRTNFKDEQGNDIVEFNVAYFDTILSEANRASALATYPEEVAKHYKRWKRGKASVSWMFLSTDTSICFYIYDLNPLFIQVIPAALEYDMSVAREAEADMEEIKKIIVQKIPNYGDGELLLEPDEAEELHKGAVSMLQHTNKHVSVLTTYADIQSISSQGTSDATKANNIEKMKGHVFNEAGISGQVFAASGNLSVELSLKNDLALMMMLGNKFSRYVTNIVNRIYGNSSLVFKYNLLPISWYNEDTYIQNALKMASSGYSLLLPALAQGFTQADLSNIKDLENNLLDLTTKLIPPQTSHTQSGEGGRPAKSNDQKAEKTIKNQDSRDNSGGA